MELNVEKIRKGLECCSDDNCCYNAGCPYESDRTSACTTKLSRDVLALIEELLMKIAGLEYEIKDLLTDNELLKNQKAMLREDLRSKKLLAADVRASALKELQNEIMLRVGTYRSDDSITVLEAMSILDNVIESIVEKGAKDEFGKP